MVETALLAPLSRLGCAESDLSRKGEVTVNGVQRVTPCPPEA